MECERYLDASDNFSSFMSNWLQPHFWPFRDAVIWNRCNLSCTQSTLHVRENYCPLWNDNSYGSIN